MPLRLLSMLLVLLLLAGCKPAPAPTPVEAVRTVLPALPTAASGAPTVVGIAPSEMAGTPTALATSTMQAPGLPGAAAFQDCALTPGLAGCGAQSLPLSGRLAFSERASGRILVFDLAAGSGWQAPGYPGGLAWSPSGDRLLAWRDTDGGRQSELWSAQGARLPDPQGDSMLRWQPDGSLSAFDTLRTPSGSQYRLELDAGPRWLLHARSAAGQEHSLTLDAQPADRLYLLLDVEPLSGRLLARRLFATNLSLAAGGELLLIDPLSGTIEDLHLAAPPDGAPGLAWSPSQPGLLAFTPALGEPGSYGLALYDFAARQRSDPLPAGVAVSSLDWSPDGTRLAFTAEPEPGQLSAAAARDYPGPGLYLLDPRSGEVALLLASPPGAADLWTRWTADGAALLLARRISRPDGQALVEIRALPIDPLGGAVQDTLLIAALPLPESPRTDWTSSLAFSPR